MATEKASNILVIDDNPDLNQLVCDYVSTLGMNATGETDPIKALPLIRSKPFDLILLDFTMPGMTGIAVLKEVRKLYSSIELPVIMVTSRSETELVVESLNEGANDYVSKPINLPVLECRMKTQLLIAKQAKEIRSAQTFKTIQTMLASYNSQIENPIELIKKVLEKIKTDSPELVKNIDRLLHLIDVSKK